LINLVDSAEARRERAKLQLFNASNCTNASSAACQQHLGLTLNTSVELERAVPPRVYFHGSWAYVKSSHGS
jgi:hypothetical protein